MEKTSVAPGGTGQCRAKEGSVAPLGSKGGALREQDAGVPFLQPPAPSLTRSPPRHTLSRGRSTSWHTLCGLMLLGATSSPRAAALAGLVGWQICMPVCPHLGSVWPAGSPPSLPCLPAFGCGLPRSRSLGPPGSVCARAHVTEPGCFQHLW